MLSLLRICFQPLIDACNPFILIPFHYRLRLLALQPVSLLAYALTGLSYQLSLRRDFETLHVPLSNGQSTIRCIVYRPTGSQSKGKAQESHQGAQDKRLFPLHISIHGGAFIGGFPEFTSALSRQLSDRAGCVVVAISYRFAPRFLYPIAHDDVCDVVAWICQHAERFWDADGSRVTVSGFSAGGNLGLNLSMDEKDRVWRAGKLPEIDGWVGFYPPIDLRIPPQQKPLPANYPKFDPVSFFLMPLFDAYAVSARHLSPPSTRLNPCLRTHWKDWSALPKRLLFLTADIDILRNEQIRYVEELKSLEEDHHVVTKVDMKLYDGAFHGWVEVPDFALPERARKAKHAAFESAIEFIKNIHRERMDHDS